jgi:prevent-host-death family protein
MDTVGLKALNQQTSQVIARVRQGERLIVTDHGRGVAMLVPIPESRFGALVEAGQVRLPSGRSAWKLPTRTSPVSTADLLSETGEDRL